MDDHTEIEKLAFWVGFLLGSLIFTFVGVFLGSRF